MAKSRRSRMKRKKSSNSVGTTLTVIGAIAILIALVGAGVFLSINTEKEIALNKNWIDKEQVLESAKKFSSNSYGEYLKQLAK